MVTVRVDAKAFGPKASECTTVDNGDGTYSITFTASVVGDYRMQARLENVEIAPISVHVAERSAMKQAMQAALADFRQGDQRTDVSK